MILEFQDGSHIEVKTIFGSPRLVMGVMRDTLSIEVDPKTISFDELKAHFKDNPKTGTLYTYTDTTTPLGDVITAKTTIGEGYKIFISISNENKKQETLPGRLVPDVYEEVYVVSIAQMTYQEHLLSTMGSVTPPDETSQSSNE